MGEAQARPLGPLASAGELARQPGWRIFDCRHDLLKPDLGEQQYREGHIPGARFAHLDRGRRALYEAGRDDAGPYQSPMEDAEVHFHEWLHRKLAL